MELSIVIVSYNTAALTLNCLESLTAADGDKEIWVVDNASTDDTVSRIRSRFPETHVIVNEIEPLCRCKQPGAAALRTLCRVS